MPVKITIYDPSKAVLRLNPEFERVVGWSAQDTANVSLMDESFPDPVYREASGKRITIIIPSDRQNEEAEILARVRHGEPVEQLETIRQSKDGTLVDISLTVSRVRDTAGKVLLELRKLLGIL